MADRATELEVTGSRGRCPLLNRRRVDWRSSSGVGGLLVGKVRMRGGRWVRRVAVEVWRRGCGPLRVRYCDVVGTLTACAVGGLKALGERERMACGVGTGVLRGTEGW